MGADRAVHVETDAKLEPLVVAKLLKAVADKENPQILLLGKQAIDDDANQVAPNAGCVVEYGSRYFCIKSAIEGEEALVTREIDGGEENCCIEAACGHQCRFAFERTTLC